jgi:hypothetical protein
MSTSRNDAEALFKRLDVQLYESIEEQYFLAPRWEHREDETSLKESCQGWAHLTEDSRPKAIDPRISTI